MENTQLTLADKIAMIIGGGLVLLGGPVLGFFETIIGSPHAVAATNEAGEIVHQTTFDPNLRATIIALGLIVWLLYAVYKVAAPRIEPTETSGTSEAAN